MWLLARSGVLPLVQYFKYLFHVLLQVFYGVLLQYFAALATEKPIAYARLNVIVKPLLEVGSETPYFAAQCARQRIVQMQKLLSGKLKNPGKYRSSFHRLDEPFFLLVYCVSQG